MPSSLVSTIRWPWTASSSPATPAKMMKATLVSTAVAERATLCLVPCKVPVFGIRDRHAHLSKVLTGRVAINGGLAQDEIGGVARQKKVQGITASGNQEGEQHGEA